MSGNEITFWKRLRTHGLLFIFLNLNKPCFQNAQWRNTKSLKEDMYLDEEGYRIVGDEFQQVIREVTGHLSLLSFPFLSPLLIHPFLFLLPCRTWKWIRVWKQPFKKKRKLVSETRIFWINVIHNGKNSFLFIVMGVKT